MATPPFDTDAGAAQVANDSYAIRAVGEVTTIILMMEPDSSTGLGDDSGNPLLENFKCHNRNPFMYSVV